MPQLIYAPICFWGKAMEEFLPMLETAAMVVGGAVAGAVDVFAEAFSQMTADPRALARDIALQLIMFTLTTVILGGLYHRFVLKPMERRDSERRAAQMEPFRRMLVMRIASVHGRLHEALTHYDDWAGHWGRPKIRSISAFVAGLSADLSSTVISNSDLLGPEEQRAVGRYSSLLFDLQGKLEEIEKTLPKLGAATVGALRELISNSNMSIRQIADAFETTYKAQIDDLSWDRDDDDAIEANLLKPLEKRVASIAARIAEAAAQPAPAMAAE